jgi:hypothetical protein
MRLRRTTALMASVAAAAGAGGIITTLSNGSSHREAPLTALDPTGDDTDVYAFKAPDAANALTIVANWIPFEDPAGGPNFYRFDDRASYYLNVDNTGDGRYDVRYRFKFHTRTRDKNSFLYALPGVSSILDPKLNVVQTYDVTRETYRDGRQVGEKVVAHNLPTAPDNVGPKTFPDYAAVAAQADRTIKGGGRVFAGQVDDPFFVDLGSTFDAINLRKGTGAQGGGRDDLAGYNVHSIVLQVPEKQVTRDGRQVAGAKAANAVVGVWSSTERPRVQVSSPVAEEARAARHVHRRSRAAQDSEVQVSRLGNPLVNEVVNPMAEKDLWNALEPSQDSRFAKYVLHPELANLIANVLYAGAFPNLSAYVTSNKPRADLAAILLTGIPSGVVPGFQNFTGPVQADMLRLNVAVPPTVDDPNPIGLVAGDPAGFPNGRRIDDDVTAIELKAFAGATIPLVDPSYTPDGAAGLLNDGTSNDNTPYGDPLLSSFPYLSNPNSGFTTVPGTPGGGL